MGVILDGLTLREIDMRTVCRNWTVEFRRRRQAVHDLRYYILCHAQELTGQIDVLADCGLQRDIRSHIHGNRLSFNRNWTIALNRADPIVRWCFDATTPIEQHSGLAAQLKVLFGRHKITRYAITLIQCDQHDYIVFLEAHRDHEVPFEIQPLCDADLLSEATRTYLAILKQSQTRSASDWEKVVHELASPLDFIYSNSDFITYYLTRTDVPDELKRKKLDDFRVVSRLLINRLHQFRFAFGSVNQICVKPENINIYELCMPITHLWHHEARHKALRFVYDELKHVRSVRSDRELLQFVLFNLVSNAIKYSDPGTEISLYASTGENGFTLGIRDKGIVVPEEEKLLIFEPGHRSESARRRDARGMGIGLGVARALMRKLGGQIDLVQSTPEETIFEIEAPEALDFRAR